jgi:limonene-1,2-epoxide hydrolase
LSRGIGRAERDQLRPLVIVHGPAAAHLDRLLAVLDDAGDPVAWLDQRQRSEVREMSQLDAMLGLIDAWKARDIDAVLSFMHDDIVWHYAAAIAPPLKGKAKARKFLESMAPQVREVTWRIFDYAERGDRLFVEGVDEYVSAEGRLVSAPYAGVVEFRDGKIIGLREYFDLGVVNALKAGEDLKEHIRLLIAREAIG